MCTVCVDCVAWRGPSDAVGWTRGTRYLRLEFLVEQRLGRRTEEVRRLGADLWHVGHLSDRHDHRRAGQFWNLSISDRDRPGLDAYSGVRGGGVAGGDPSIIYG